MIPQLDCIVSPAARAVLEGLGRTEDVMFSPDGRRLALVGYVRNRIAVFDVAVVASSEGKKVVVNGVVELSSATLEHPHGLCFLDDRAVAVANRTGGVHVYDVPPSSGGAVHRVVEPVQTITGSAAAPIRTPGSVTALPLASGALELLVCHNYSNVVTRHVIGRERGWASSCDEVLLRRGLAVPDGICHSADGAWIAVSNHDKHEVLVYRRTPALGPDALPDAVLRNVLCPHGVRFTRDARHVLVADAHARYVNVYARGASGWDGVRDPVRMAPVLDRATFLRGRSNPEEGGPKGIDVDAGMSVVACTTEFQTLAFFDLDTVLAARAPLENRHKRYVGWRLARAIHRRRPSLYGWLRPLSR
jgi:sugar lactone lactonase YvrE